MRTLTKIAVALTAVVSCAAFAQTDPDADRARRDRNVDEVLARHHLQRDQMNDAQALPSDRPGLRERSHRVAQTTREKTHKVAQSTRDFTHRQAEKARDFGARQNAKYPANPDHPAVKPGENTPS